MVDEKLSGKKLSASADESANICVRPAEVVVTFGLESFPTGAKDVTSHKISDIVGAETTVVDDLD